jgi:hypothetical protein
MRFVEVGFSWLLVVFFAGCGTTHHFLPPEPLPDGDWKITVSWHRDVKELGSPKGTIVPDVNAYWGLDRHNVVGFGVPLFPIVPTHLSWANYQNATDGNYHIVWTHLNIAAPHNTTAEVGYGFSIKSATMHDLFALGLGIVQRGKWQIGGANTTYSASTGPFPILKYSGQGRNVGVDVVHTFGNYKTLIKKSFPKWPPTADTVMRFDPGEVVGVAEFDSRPQVPSLFELWRYRFVKGLVLRTGDTLFLMGKPMPHPDIYAPRDDIELQEWIGTELMLVWFATMRVSTDQWAVVDLEAVETAVREGRALVITRAPQSLVDRVDAMNSLLLDNSFGWSVSGWPK